MQYATSFSITSHLRMDRQIKRVNFSFLWNNQWTFTNFLSTKHIRRFIHIQSQTIGAIPLGEDTDTIISVF